MNQKYSGCQTQSKPKSDALKYEILTDLLCVEKYETSSDSAKLRSFVQPPFIYAYHTHRPHVSPIVGRNPVAVEDIGVQVLVTQRSFSFDMSILAMDVLKAGELTTIVEGKRDKTYKEDYDCPPISLGHISRFAMTAECTYSKNAKKGLRIHIRGSYDGIHYDTADLYAFDNDFKPGKIGRKTVEFRPGVRFIKVLVENLDSSEDISDLRIMASLGGG
ncbi:hypothetical protein ACFL1G_07655 [Planctomycetota bacterium]